MTVEASVGVSDTVAAELVECAPAPEPVKVVVLPTPSDAVTPTRQVQDAMLGQTGADPPPDGDR